MDTKKEGDNTELNLGEYLRGAGWSYKRPLVWELGVYSIVSYGFRWLGFYENQALLGVAKCSTANELSIEIHDRNIK